MVRGISIPSRLGKERQVVSRQHIRFQENNEVRNKEENERELLERLKIPKGRGVESIVPNDITVNLLPLNVHEAQLTPSPKILVQLNQLVRS